MSKCLLCHQPLRPPMTLAQFWCWQPLPVPVVCQRCIQQFDRISATHCPQCGRQQTKMTVCHDCDRWGDQRLQNHAVYTYNEAMKAYMQQYKFQGDYALRQVMMAPLQQALMRETYDVLVPIPVNQETWQARGFNQVTGWLRNQPFQQVLLVTADHKEQPQSAKTRQQRLLTQQPFSLAPNAARVLAGKQILLLDDVYTTGRTLRHAATQIYLGGAKAVTSLTLAR
ncbi:ComF family protein [Levilactobacillus enshiensis]|uniref:ComF family protein n=1 Tax=Levilactobacillus enshiensis TaxID=2590213 RepID=UPI00117B5F66|nr:ComF family protein [Levilactobacillus enshiensis]